jgi:hypothetical protein
MTDTTTHHDAHRAKAEHSALVSLAQRLASQFPELSSDEIDRTIQGEYEGYDNSAIRDFVPVLVERAVRADLSRPARHRA